MNRLLGLVAIVACGTGSPGSPSPSARVLAHAVPAANPLTYTLADTTGISMNMQGQSIQIDATSQATIELMYGPGEAGAIPVTVEYRILQGRFSNPMGGATSLTDADRPGPASLTVTPTGKVTVAQLPQMTPAALQVIGTESSLKRLFPPLPSAPVSAGTAWTDTVSTVDDNAGLRSSSTAIVRSTLTGDTTIAGRRLHVILSESDVTAEIAGSTQGFEIRQNLNGTSRGTVLWDPAIGALFERQEITSMAGTMAMPGMGMSGIPVSFESRQVMRLQTGASR